MSINYWDDLPESDGEYTQSVSSDPAPEGTRGLCDILEVKWDSLPGSTHEHISIKWMIVEPEEYNGKKFYHNIKINGEDPAGQYYKADKQEKIRKDARNMLAAIDKNAGGKLFAIRRLHTNDDFKACLESARMMLALGAYNNKQVVRGVSANPNAGSQVSKQAQNSSVAAKTSQTPANVTDIDEDLIPF